MEDLAAVGMKDGTIRFWRFDTQNSKSIKELYHWHSHQCRALQFTEDGIYLISGGEEAVLVIWQLQTGRRQFIPGLGTAISHISVSPNSKYYAVSTSGNCIHLINSVSSKIHKTIISIVHGK